MEKVRLAENLRFILRSRKMRAITLAKASGISKQTISDWMNGVQPRELDKFYQVAKSLDVSMTDLAFKKMDSHG